MFTVIICDDNRPFCDLLEKVLKKYAEPYDVQIVKFYDGDSLLEYCGNKQFDIAYLDIEIGKENGLNIAKKLKYFNPKAIMIYVSSHENYYMDMLQAEPFRFIKKELTDIEKFENELKDSFLDAFNRISGAVFTFEFKKEMYTIELNKVKYFYSIARTIHICGDTGNIPSYFYGKIDKLQEELQKIDDNFVRISKSYIVNINYVRVNSKKQVIIEDKILSVTSKYKADFLNNYYSRIREM